MTEYSSLLGQNSFRDQGWYYKKDGTEHVVNVIARVGFDSNNNKVLLKIDGVDDITIYEDSSANYYVPYVFSTYIFEEGYPSLVGYIVKRTRTSPQTKYIAFYELYLDEKDVTMSEFVEVEDINNGMYRSLATLNGLVDVYNSVFYKYDLDNQNVEVFQLEPFDYVIGIGLSTYFIRNNKMYDENNIEQNYKFHNNDNFENIKLINSSSYFFGGDYSYSIVDSNTDSHIITGTIRYSKSGTAKESYIIPQIQSIVNGEDVSLLAKWLPVINDDTHSLYGVFNVIFDNQYNRFTIYGNTNPERTYAMAPVDLNAQGTTIYNGTITSDAIEVGDGISMNIQFPQLYINGIRTPFRKYNPDTGVWERLDNFFGEE